MDSKLASSAYSMQTISSEKSPYDREENIVSAQHSSSAGMKNNCDDSMVSVRGGSRSNS